MQYRALLSVQHLKYMAALATGIGDLERALARIQASSAAEAEGANTAIYYEDTAKRKVLSLVTALRGLQSLQVYLSFQAATLVTTSSRVTQVPPSLEA